MIPLALCFLLACTTSAAQAHPLRTGYLELQEEGAGAFRVLWSMPALEPGLPAVQLEFAGGCVEDGRHDAEGQGGQAVRAWRIRCDRLESVAARGLTAAQADILVRSISAGGAVVNGRLAPLAPTMHLPRVPRGLALARTYFALGVEHILTGIDHLLFVTALMLLVAGLPQLLATVTAFTLAHSLTLGLAVLGPVRAPQPPVEALIAFSIALAAAAALRRGAAAAVPSRERPWLIALVLGLLHGLGFAGALGAVGLPAGAILPALLFFNLGVEAGQLAFVAALLATAALWRAVPLLLPRWTAALPAYAIGSLAMFWTVDRVASFWR